MAVTYEYRYCVATDNIELASWVSADGPQAVTGFSGTPGEGSIEYTWDAAEIGAASRPGPVTGFSGEVDEGSITYTWNAAEIVTGTISLAGLLPGTKYAFQTRARDESFNYSAPTRTFYATTPYALGLLAFGDGDAVAGDGEDAIGTYVGHYLEVAE
jgi:hypothetical protein